MAMFTAVELQPGSKLPSPLREDDSSIKSKKSFRPYHAQHVPKSEHLEASRTGHVSTVTTVMLRNLPNKYTQNTLMQEINELGFCGTYNFFYLPMDVHNRSNVGYAFINFEHPEDAERFRQSFSEHRFQRVLSRKIGSVCTAHVQGLDENLQHFSKKAVTQARNDQYRPVVLKGQRRIDFEDAVAEAKARLRGEVMAPQSGKQCPPWVLREAPAVPRPRPADRALPSNEIDRALLEAQNCEADYGRGGRAARQALEAAIRDYLVTSDKENMAGSEAVMAPPGLQHPNYFGADTDITQLLSSRSCFVDRHLQKNEATDFEAIQILRFGISSGFDNGKPEAMNSFTYELEANSLTPRTNALSMWTTLDGVSQDHQWLSL